MLRQTHMGMVYRLLGVAVVAGVLAGCGPIQYVDTVTRKASSSVEAAKSVNADKYAPYYYTLAVEYFRRAKHEAAHSDYQAANRFGEKSHKAAEMAKKVAVQRARDGDLPDVSSDDAPKKKQKQKKGVAPLVPDEANDE